VLVASGDSLSVCLVQDCSKRLQRRAVSQLSCSLSHDQTRSRSSKSIQRQEVTVSGTAVV